MRASVEETTSAGTSIVYAEVEKFLYVVIYDCRAAQGVFTGPTSKSISYSEGDAKLEMAFLPANLDI